MPKFETLFSKYDRLVLFDTETTGLLFSRDELSLIHISEPTRH